MPVFHALLPGLGCHASGGMLCPAAWQCRLEHYGTPLGRVLFATVNPALRNAVRSSAKCFYFIINERSTVYVNDNVIIVDEPQPSSIIFVCKTSLSVVLLLAFLFADGPWVA